jgi:sulfofructose kinase
MDTRYDVLGLGCVAIDDFLFVPEYPAADAKVQVRRRERQCGGLTATALVAAARLGARCAFAGVLGADADSRFVTDTFEREGVDTTTTVRRPEARPIRSTIVVDESRQTRTIFYDLAGATGADALLPPDAVIRAARVLFVDHYGIEGMIRATRVALAAGRSVVADFERSDWPGFADLLGLVDHLIVAEGFAAKLTGCADAAAALDRLWTPARQVVVVTCGERGGFYRARDEASVRRYAAFPVDVVDTTGCGDVFHGAYAATLARDLSLQERLRFSAAAAALKARHPGAQRGIPTQAAVEDFLKGNGIRDEASATPFTKPSRTI